jgi:hypothetical protein
MCRKLSESTTPFIKIFVSLIAGFAMVNLLQSAITVSTMPLRGNVYFAILDLHSPALSTIARCAM